ncbi:MAG: hypothetical protein RL692_1326, partial [Planctomycetota bacterium]
MQRQGFELFSNKLALQKQSVHHGVPVGNGIASIAHSDAVLKYPAVY